MKGTALTADASVPPAVVEVVQKLTEPVAARPLSALYSEYEIRLRYDTDPHVAVCPEQAKDGKTAFVKLAATTTYLYVEWSAERVGDPPEIPREEDTAGDDNLVWLGGSLSPPTPVPGPDGVTMVFKASGTIRYGLRDPKKKKYGSAILPWVAELCGRPAVPTVVGGPQLVVWEKGKPSNGPPLLNPGSSSPVYGPAPWQIDWAKWVKGGSKQS